MKRLLIKIFVCLLLVFTIFSIDKKASQYGKGVYFFYYPLKYDLNLYYLNKIVIGDYDGGKGVTKDAGYKINNKDSLFIKKIIGYSNNKDELVVYIRDKEDKYFSMVFNSLELVDSNKPIIKNINQSDIDSIINKGVNLEQVPMLFYYWRAIFFLSIFCITIYFIIFIIKYACKIFKL